MATYSSSRRPDAGYPTSPTPVSPSQPQQSQGEWWFRLTAPQEPPNATFAQREAARRGRLASLTLLFISLFTLVPIPNAILHGETPLIAVQLITFLIDLFALFVLNKRGYLAAAGWLVVLVLDGGFALAFMSIPQGVSIGLLPAFDIMAESLMVVVAFFSPRSVFIVMAINIIFIVSWLNFGKHTPDISFLLKNDAYYLFYPPLSLEIFEAVLAFLWVSSATRAIAALDRSEEIVALERREIEQQEKELQLKQQLEDGIEQILQTHVKAANGDFAARAPLNKDNVLWQIAYSLNNLLSRLQRYGQLQTEMRRTQEAVRLLTEHVRAAKANKQPLLSIQRTGTVLDELIVELMAPTIPEEFPPSSRRPNSSRLIEESPQNAFRDPRFYPRRPSF